MNIPELIEQELERIHKYIEFNYNSLAKAAETKQKHEAYNRLEAIKYAEIQIETLQRLKDTLEYYSKEHADEPKTN